MKVISLQSVLIVGLLLPIFPAAGQVVPTSSQPVITSLDPSGAIPQSSLVRISGTGFEPGSQVIFTETATRVQWVIFGARITSTAITFSLPFYIAPNDYEVTVRNDNLISTAVALRVVPLLPQNSSLPFISPTPTATQPQLTGITPSQALVASGTLISISGNNLSAFHNVSFNAPGASWLIISARLEDNHIVFNLPNYVPPGQYSVVVNTAASASNALPFTVVAAASPTPTIGPTPTILPTPTFGPTPTPGNAKQYTALGDSIAFGLFGFPSYVERYAQAFRAAAQPVNVTNDAQIGANSDRLLNTLRTDNSVRQAVAQANIITWNIGGVDARAARESYQARTCGAADNQECLRRSSAHLKANWSGIIAQILSLRGGHPTIIRTMDLYNPYVFEDSRTDSWPNDGKNDFQVFKTYLDDTNAYMRNVASGNGIGVAHVYEAFNGPAGNLDPSLKRLISFDGFHPNTEGHRLIAELLVQVGF